MPGRGTKRTGAPVEDTQTETPTPKDTPAKKTRKSTPQAEDPLLPAAGEPGKPDDHVGKSSGKDPAVSLWQKGTSESEWDCKLPTSLETPDPLPYLVPR